MSFPRYPKYKDSGVEWLGEVPEHWNVCALKRIVRMQSGESITGENIEQTGEYAVFGGNGIRGYTTNFTHDGRFVLIGRQGALCGNVNYGSGKFWASEHAVVVTPIKPIDVIWLGETLRTMNLNQYSVSAAQPGLSVEQIIRLRVAVPPRSEQIQIANFLDLETAKIDELIAEQRRLIELLKEKRQAVISHAVTKGLNPDAPMKPSGIEWLGDVPAHWTVVPLKRIARVNTGVAKGKDNGSRSTVTVPYLRVANVQDGYLDLETVATIEIPEDDLPRYALKSGDVLMNEGGDFDKLGRGHVWEGQIDPCITQNHVFAVRPQSVSSNWLNVITGSDYAQFYFVTRSKQSTNLASISSTNLMRLPVVLPPAAEQQSILSFVNARKARYETLVLEAQRTIDLLQERRTALISAAVTGQIDVRRVAESEAA